MPDCSIARKYATPVDNLAALAERYAADLALIDAGTERLKVLERAVAEADKRYFAAAEATDGNGEATVRREAEDFLLDFLMDGPKPAKEWKAAAKSRLRIASVKDGMTGGWVWSLPVGDI